MKTQTIHMSGKPYVVLERRDYDKLVTLAKAAELPELPAPDAKGNYPAVDYLRMSIARDRVKAGLSQKKLAKRAGIRVETLCRIETGKHTPSVASIDKIERALKNALKGK